MFNTPIRHTPLTTYQDVINFSMSVSQTFERNQFMTKHCYNDFISFVDKDGNGWITPFRWEIEEILEKEGFTNDILYFDSISNKLQSARYIWLKKMAEQENMNKIYADAKKLSANMAIKGVVLDGIQYHVREIKSSFQENGLTYKPFVLTFFNNNEVFHIEEFITTFIIINEKKIVICDEYARTFLVTVKDTVNTLVNQLLSANYRYNSLPNLFVEITDPKQNALDFPELDDTTLFQKNS